MRTKTFKVIMASELKRALDFFWTGFSFGDAKYTLVERQQLIEEVAPFEDQWPDLIQDIRNIPDGVLIAFEG